MKRIIALILTLSLVTLTACSSGGTSAGSGSASLTPEEQTQRYVDAITNGRDDADNKDRPIMSATDAQDAEMVFQLLGFTAEDVTSFAISVSLMNVQAYGVAVVMPAEGKADAVKAGLQGYIDGQASSFEYYLADQYEIAKGAHLETLEDGTLIMVMCADQDAVYEAISSALVNV